MKSKNRTYDVLINGINTIVENNDSFYVDTIIRDENPDLKGFIVFKNLKLNNLTKISNGLNKDLPLVITKKHVYTIIRSDGIIKGKNVNYHNVGKTTFLESIKRIDNPDIVIKTTRGIVEAIEIKDIHNNPIIISILLNEKIRNTEIKANIIGSIYGKKDFEKYIQNKKIIYIKSDIALSNTTLDITSTLNISKTDDAVN